MEGRERRTRERVKRGRERKGGIGKEGIRGKLGTVPWLLEGQTPAANFL